jgi:hypothetical protein
MVDCFVSEVKMKGHWNSRGASERRVALATWVICDSSHHHLMDNIADNLQPFIKARATQQRVALKRGDRAAGEAGLCSPAVLLISSCPRTWKTDTGSPGIALH